MGGYLHCEQKFNPLFSTFPRLLCVRRREGSVVLGPVGTGNKDRSLSFHAGLWLNTTLYYLIRETQAQNPNNQPMLARLTELMFVEVLRHSMQELSPDQKGRLAGLKDPNINRALTLLHAQRAQLIMQVRSGVLSAQEAARQLGISRKTYYKWERRALAAMVEALGHREQDRPPRAIDPEKEALRRQTQEPDKKSLRWPKWW